MNQYIEQRRVFYWCHGALAQSMGMRLSKLAPCVQEGYPEAQMLYSIPKNVCISNDFHGLLMKRIGLATRVFDMFLPISIITSGSVIPGLFIKMMSMDGSISEDQSAFIQAVHKQGYAVRICWGYEEAVRDIKLYLDLSRRMNRKRGAQFSKTKRSCLQTDIFLHLAAGDARRSEIGEKSFIL